MGFRLTGDGHEIAHTFGAREWAREIASGLLDTVEGYEDYQVWEFAGRYVKGRLTYEDDCQLRRARTNTRLRTRMCGTCCGWC